MNEKQRKDLFILLEAKTGMKNELSRKVIKSYRETYDAAFNTLDDGRISVRVKNKIYGIITRLLFEDLKKVKKIDKLYRKKERREARALKRLEKPQKKKFLSFLLDKKNTPKNGDKGV